MSTLRPTAAAFVPSFAASASLQPIPNAPPGSGQDAAGQQDEKQQQQEQPVQHFAEDVDAAGEAYEDEDGYYDELGNWVQYDETDSWPHDWQHYSSSTWQEQQLGATQQADEEDDDAIWQYTEGSNDQAVQLLHSWFPSQPLSLLRQLLEACDGRLQEALQIISDIDSEQQQQQQIRPSLQEISSSKAATQANKQLQLSLQDDELFPALPAAAAAAQQQQPPAASARPARYHLGSLWGDKPAHANASSSGSSRSSSNTSSWSALAKAAAAAAPSSEAASSSPASRSRAAAGMATATPTNSRAASRKAAAGVGAAEQHAVPWVQTGEAVAQEYAAARAEASDHARVRNACFQQATQAYLAGEQSNQSINNTYI
jgi:hypothetical protein